MPTRRPSPAAPTVLAEWSLASEANQRATVRTPKSRTRQTSVDLRLAPSSDGLR